MISLLREFLILLVCVVLTLVSHLSRKHQRQLENGNFLSPDDKIKRKLETEIENLKHCKVRLRDYLAAKSRIDSKVNEQDALRKKRDVSYLARDLHMVHSIFCSLVSIW